MAKKINKKRNQVRTGSGRRFQKEAKNSAKKSEVSLPRTPAFFKPQYLIWILLAIGMAIVASIRMNLVDIPFQRDEGVYSYMGWILLQGGKPYLDFYEMKPPGLYLSYALMVALFGFTVKGLHIGFMMLNLISMALVYLIGKHLLNAWSGLVAGVSFGFLALTPAFHGFSIQAEHILVPIALGGILLTLKSLSENNRTLLLLGGFMCGLAFVVKQNALFYSAFSGLAILLHYLMGEKKSIKETLLPAGLFTAAALIPVALALLSLGLMGVFDEFWYWVIEYPQTYLSRISFSQGWEYAQYWFKGGYLGYESFWLLFALGIVLTGLLKMAWYKKIMLWSLVFFSFLTIVPGLRFYGYYWIMTLPAVTIMIGLCFYALQSLLGKWLKGGLTVLPGLLIMTTLLGMHMQGMDWYYYRPNFNQLMRVYYGGNAFYEIKVLTDHLNKTIKPEDTFLTFGSEPQAYVYTQKRSPTRHIFMSFVSKGTPESMEWAEEAKLDIEAAKPEYILFAINSFSWNAQDQSFYQWAYKYTKANYVPISYADVISPGKAKYVWEDQARSYSPQSQNYYTVYKRRN